MSFVNQKEERTPYLLGADLKNRNQITVTNKPKTKTTHILLLPVVGIPAEVVGRLPAGGLKNKEIRTEIKETTKIKEQLTALLRRIALLREILNRRVRNVTWSNNNKKAYSLL
jgi:hypothetical protein